MRLEATRQALRYRLKSGQEFLLKPGCPVDIPDEAAQSLLTKAGDQVRVVPEVTIEPAHPNARPVYWERGTGEIAGPAQPEFLAKAGDTFWVVCQFQGVPVWVNADRLRSQQAFERQVKPKIVELVKEPR